MRLKNLQLLVLVLLFMSPATYSSAQVIGDTKVLVPDNGYEFTGVASTSLVWPEGKIQYVTLNLTQTVLPTNTSRIYVDVVAFQVIGVVSGVDTLVDVSSITPELILSANNQTYFLNQTMIAPDIVDTFYLNISMSVGTSFDRSQRQQSLIFPDEGTIFVDRDKLVPLVNLYGFPPSSFFQKILPIYGSILLIMAIPGIYSSASSYSSRRKLVKPDENEKGDENNE